MDVYDEINIITNFQNEVDQPQLCLEFDIPYEHITFPIEQYDEINPNIGLEFDIHIKINPNINFGCDTSYEHVTSSIEEYAYIDPIFEPKDSDLQPYMNDPITDIIKQKQKQKQKQIKQKYECSIEHCTKILYSKTALQEHMNSHSDSKPYKCPECNKGFNNNANLSRHKRIHTGQQPFSCVNCGRKFNQSNNKYSHEKRCVKE